MIIMIGSGWKIYNDEVLFGWLHFPDWITIGGEAQGALQWHFFAMWILTLNGLAYLIYGLVTGRFRRMLLPIRLREVIADSRATPCGLRLAHDDITRYNAVQRTALCRHHPGHHRAGALRAGRLEADAVLGADHAVLRLPGRAAGAFPRHGGDRLFLLVHVALALLVPKTLVAMVTGGPELDAHPRAVPPAPARHDRARHRPTIGAPRDETHLLGSLFRPSRRSTRASSPRTRRSSRRSTAASCCAARSALAP